MSNQTGQINKTQTKVADKLRGGAYLPFQNEREYN